MGNIVCPECSDSLMNFEYDGSVETTYTYRKVDEARIKEAEVDKLIRLKELEIKQKELDRKAERYFFISFNDSNHIFQKKR